MIVDLGVYGLFLPPVVITVHHVDKHGGCGDHQTTQQNAGWNTYTVVLPLLVLHYAIQALQPGVKERNHRDKPRYRISYSPSPSPTPVKVDDVVGLVSSLLDPHITINKLPIQSLTLCHLGCLANMMHLSQHDLNKI